jgi:hypothetical protein
MSSRKSIHFKELMGERVANDDGFTYNYGAVKAYKARSRHSRPTVKAQVRHDKRAVRAAELRDTFKEE